MEKMDNIYIIIAVLAGLSMIVLILYNFSKGKYLEYHKIYITLTLAGSLLVLCPLLAQFEITGSDKGVSIIAKLKDTVGQLSIKVVELNSPNAKQTIDKKVAEQLIAQNKVIIELQEKLKESKDQRETERVLKELNTATAAVKVPGSVSKFGVVDGLK